MWFFFADRSILWHIFSIKPFSLKWSFHRVTDCDLTHCLSTVKTIRNAFGSCFFFLIIIINQLLFPTIIGHSSCLEYGPSHTSLSVGADWKKSHRMIINFKRTQNNTMVSHCADTMLVIVRNLVWVCSNLIYLSFFTYVFYNNRQIFFMITWHGTALTFFFCKQGGHQVVAAHEWGTPTAFVKLLRDQKAAWCEELISLHGFSLAAPLSGWAF